MSLEGKTVEEIEALAELAAALGSDPRTRAQFLAGTKVLNPNANIPELDIPRQLAAQFKGPLDRLAQLEAQAIEREKRDRILAQRSGALAVPGITAADIPDVEALMVARRILDHKTAAEFHLAQKRVAEPTPSSMAGLRRFGQPALPDLTAFNGDLKAYTYKQAYAAIDELRGRRAA